jgi:DNA-binding MarR family transcriptional regulator
MHVPTFTDLLRAGETDSGARDFGRMLASGNQIDLGLLQRTLGQLAQDPAPGDPDPSYTRGFVQALAMVAAGFSSQRDHELRADADAAAARSRPHWMPVLAAIRDDCATPGEVARSAQLDPATVSRVLGAMDECGLLMRRDPEAGEDGRTRPFVLTPSGDVLCERLFAPSTGPIDALIEGTVSCTAHLLATGRITRAGIRAEFSRLDPARADAAAASVTRTLHGTCLAVLDDDDESVVATIRELHREIDRELAEACEAPDTSPFVTQLRQLADGETLYFRTSTLPTRWEVVIKQLDLDTVQLLRDDDPLPTPSVDARYRILYESRALLARDRARGADPGGLDEVLRRATTRCVFDLSTGAPTDDGFTSLRPGAPGGSACHN